MDIFDNDKDFVAEVFGQGGFISKQFAEYEPRVGQVELAYAVLDGMQDGYNVVVEAPTGTGKSLGYGMPAALMAARGERAVIVTANIALQEQLIQKDLPLLEKALPWKFTYALAKGLNNYLCLDEFDESMNETIITGFEGSRVEREQWDQVVKWKAGTMTGDVSELPFESKPAVRHRFTIMSEDCIGNKCGHFEVCHGLAARRDAKNANIVVTNYALFFADLVIKRNGSDGILPQYSHVIFDEAHKAADLARGFMGFRLTRGSVAHSIKLLDNKQSAKSKRGFLPVIDAALKQSAIGSADQLFAMLTKLYHSPKYDIRFKRPWKEEALSLAQMFKARMDACASQLTEAASLTSVLAERAIELLNAAGKCKEHGVNVMRIAEFEENDWVFYMQEENDRIVMKGNPVSVASYLRENLFNFKDKTNPIKSVTVTSATLATSVDDYEYITTELGITNAETSTVETPFDIKANTLVVCPPMPAPSSRDFAKSLAERILDVVDEVGGRTLCLFTSHRNMNAVYDLVRKDIQYTLLKQGDKPRTMLIDEFKNNVDSVLFGTESFWAGVDVPGESLSCVVIDKLPFPNISDPVQDVLKLKHDRSYFSKFSIPIAVIAFRQGCGRLLRTVTDRGAIVVLDSRITEKGYGKKFTRSFPQCTNIVRDLGEIGFFLSNE